MEEYPFDQSMKRLTLVVAVVMVIGAIFFGTAESEADDSTAFILFVQSETLSPPAQQGDVNEGQTQTHELELSRTNLEKVTAVLEWQEDDQSNLLGDNDEFELEVVAPAGTLNLTFAPPGSSDRDRSGRLTLIALLDNGRPENEAQVRGASKEAVEAAYTTDNGAGTWTFNVTCTNDDGGLDSGNDYTLTLQVDYFTVVAQLPSQAL